MFFLLITAIEAFIAPLKSFILQWIIDASSKERALYYLLLGSIITVLSFLMELFSQNLATKIECESIKTIRARLMEKVLYRDMAHYLQKGNSDTISKLTNDMRILYDDYFSAIYTVIFYGGMLFFALCMYIYIDPILLIFVALASIVPLT